MGVGGSLPTKKLIFLFLYAVKKKKKKKKDSEYVTLKVD